MSKYKKPFRFKQFTMEHDKCAMKIGFDGALLAAWVNPNNPLNILDIGCGSGLISMMLRQRFPNANITAIDPNEGAIIQSEINFSNSPFEKGFELKKTTLQDFETENKFDLILSNPPFFTEDTGSGDLNRDQARMEKYLPLEELLSKIKSLLTTTGQFYLIYPTWESEKIISYCNENDLYINTQTLVFSNREKPSKRSIFEISLVKKDTILNEFISGNQDIGYTKEYQSLLKDFYTIF